MAPQQERHAAHLRSLLQSCADIHTRWVATQSHAVSAISLLADTLARLMTIRESELSAFGSLAAFANIKEQLIQSHERECERLRKSLLDDLHLFRKLGEEALQKRAEAIDYIGENKDDLSLDKSCLATATAFAPSTYFGWLCDLAEAYSAELSNKEAILSSDANDADTLRRLATQLGSEECLSDAKVREILAQTAYGVGAEATTPRKSPKR